MSTRPRLRIVAVAIAVSGLTGCAVQRGPRPRLEPAVRADPWRAPSWLNGVRLREGDIILTRFPDFSAALHTLHVPDGRYAHSMMVARDRNGQPVAVQMHMKGLEVHPLQPHLARYAKAAVLRHREADAGADARLGDAARQWIDRSRRDRIEFDLDGAGPDASRLAMNCVGLLNAIHRDAGLPEPFVVRAARPNDAWAGIARRMIGVDLPSLAMPYDALHHPDFTLLASGWNPAVDPRIIAVQEEIAEAVRRYTTDGFIPRPPRWSERAWIAATHRIAKEPDFIFSVRQARVTVLDFVRRAENPLSDYLARAPDATIDTARRLARGRCDELRDACFILAPGDWTELISRWDAAIGAGLREWIPDDAPEPAEWIIHRRRADIPDLPFAAVLRDGNAVTDYATGVIHLPVWRERDPPDSPRSPLRMLRHEAGHWHLHRATSVPLPPAIATRFGIDRLPTAPWWVHEGWAAHVEVAGIENGRLMPRETNAERARDLRALIQSGRCPNPLEVVSRTHRDGGGAAEYAVAWGLVQDLLHPSDAMQREERHARFRLFLQACRRGFHGDAAAAAGAMTATSSTPAAFRQQWDERMTQESAREFRRLFVDPVADEAWTAAWMRRMASTGGGAR